MLYEVITSFCEQRKIVLFFIHRIVGCVSQSTLATLLAENSLSVFVCDGKIVLFLHRAATEVRQQEQQQVPPK